MSYEFPGKCDDAATHLRHLCEDGDYCAGFAEPTPASAYGATAIEGSTTKKAEPR